MEDLIDAAASGLLEEHLAAGHSINVAADSGITALHALARSGSGSRRDRAALRSLLANGIDVNGVNFRNETALFRAVFNCCNWMCEDLVAHGARWDIPNNKGQSLFEVASNRNPEMLRHIQAWVLDSMTPVSTGQKIRRSL